MPLVDMPVMLGVVAASGSGQPFAWFDQYRETASPPKLVRNGMLGHPSAISRSGRKIAFKGGNGSLMASTTSWLKLPNKAPKGGNTGSVRHAGFAKITVYT